MLMCSGCSEREVDRLNQEVGKDAQKEKNVKNLLDFRQCRPFSSWPAQLLCDQFGYTNFYLRKELLRIPLDTSFYKSLKGNVSRDRRRVGWLRRYLRD